MKKKLILFGLGDMAQLAHYYFSRFSSYEIVAFTVDSAYIKEPSFCGLPVLPFEDIERHFPPGEFEAFVAISYSKLNQIRKEKYLAAKAKGYSLASFTSPHATVLNDGNIGENCFIFEDNTIQPFVSIGHNVTLWSGNHIGHHSIIRDHCFIASHVVVSGHCDIGECCFLGVNATLRDHITIGEKCVIGAGTLMLAGAEPGGVFIGKGTERAGIDSSNLRKL